MHSACDKGALKRHLRGILGDEGFVALCQELGGTRVYIPYNLRDDHDIVQAVGREKADKLCREMAPATIRVPLARRERALFYRAQKLSDARIARKLGMTENGVGKLFAREGHLSDRGDKSSNPAQFDLF